MVGRGTSCEVDVKSKAGKEVCAPACAMVLNWIGMDNSTGGFLAVWALLLTVFNSPSPQTAVLLSVLNRSFTLLDPR